MELTLEQIKELVYDARVNPDRPVDELVQRFEKPKTPLYRIVEIAEEEQEMPYVEMLNAFLVFYSNGDGTVTVLKNRAGDTGKMTEQKLKKYVEDINWLCQH